tara:strand:- start:335 stop:577 length:243 start_codon:yes stop_codon:yes gene_type:complete
MIFSNPELPASYETCGDCYLTQARIFEQMIAEHEHGQLTELEQEFLESCREGIEQTRRCARIYMKMAAIAQQVIDEEATQ